MFSVTANPVCFAATTQDYTINLITVLVQQCDYAAVFHIANCVGFDKVGFNVEKVWRFTSSQCALKYRLAFVHHLGALLFGRQLYVQGLGNTALEFFEQTHLVYFFEAHCGFLSGV
ncbi:hypothetical protein D3C80_1013010 [compost metagenome]